MSALLIDTTEAGRMLGISADVVRRYCRNGRLRAHAIGTQWLIAPAEVRRFGKIPRNVGRPAGPG